MKCYKCTWKNCHLRTKLTFSLHSVANISENMLAIIYNVSHWVPLGVTRCIHGFLIVFFCGFSRRVLKWQCILYMRMNSRSHMLQMFFQILSLCDVNHFHVGWCAMFKGFQCFDGPFRVYMSPLTLFEKHNWEVCFMLISNGQINARNTKDHLHFFFFFFWLGKN